jgi:4-alpha-glucanotransferase
MACSLDRSAGVLLHPTSLPSRFGIGDLGPSADAYLRWLASTGVSWWQVLPLHPPGPGWSPYSALSTFAGSELLISPEQLVDDGLLVAARLDEVPEFPAAWVDYGAVSRWKRALMRDAFAAHRRDPRRDLADELESFRERHRQWLEDWALFLALRRHHDGAAWYDWPRPLAFREPEAIADWRDHHRDEIEIVVFCQFLFFRQWARVRETARAVGVSILGDVPIFVARDSADVWAHPDLFQLDENREPVVVGGAPPDYFSATGQLWGNPVYDWKGMAERGFPWWIERLRHELKLADAVRLDHFRGFAAYWEVPADHDVATNGRWVPGPGLAFFNTVAEALGGLPFVAEDLGEITADVVELRKQLELPGMAILQFAFTPADRSLFLPYQLEPDLVVYTGTHDNNTSLGWYLEDAGEVERDFVRRYCGTDGHDIHWDLIRLAMASVGSLAIVPHQDLAGLGSDCRMNTPSVADGNWTFRITPWMLSADIRNRLADLVWVYGRAPGLERESEAEGER